MEWHAGNMLSQTVFTLLYVHHLTDFNPDLIPMGTLKRDPSRPPELITVVLRAAVLGLLKSCDLAWRELAQDKVHDVSSSFSHSYVACKLLNTVVHRARTGKVRNVKYLFWRAFQSSTFSPI
jgi:Mak10 subunit, NatC N(alpha)-terminal acetyltransferase